MQTLLQICDSPASGVISGSPTTAATYSVTVTATDGVSVPGSVSFSWSIVNGLTLSALSGSPQVNGTNVSLTAGSTGGTNPRYTWSHRRPFLKKWNPQ